MGANGQRSIIRTISVSMADDEAALFDEEVAAMGHNRQFTLTSPQRQVTLGDESTE